MRLWTTSPETPEPRLEKPREPGNPVPTLAEGFWGLAEKFWGLTERFWGLADRFWDLAERFQDSRKELEENLFRFSRDFGFFPRQPEPLVFCIGNWYEHFKTKNLITFRGLCDPQKNIVGIQKFC